MMPKLGEVFLDVSSLASREVTQYKTGLFGRSQVIIIIINIKGWVEKNLLFEKIAIALEGERFVLGGCPFHHLLYS